MGDEGETESRRHLGGTFRQVKIQIGHQPLKMHTADSHCRDSLQRLRGLYGGNSVISMEAIRLL
jgi:hypothetical protein